MHNGAVPSRQYCLWINWEIFTGNNFFSPRVGVMVCECGCTITGVSRSSYRIAPGCAVIILLRSMQKWINWKWNQSWSDNAGGSNRASYVEIISRVLETCAIATVRAGRYCNPRPVPVSYQVTARGEVHAEGWLESCLVIRPVVTIHFTCSIYDTISFSTINTGISRF